MHSISRYVAGCFGIDSEQGVTAVEFGLIAALIAVTVVSAVTLVGTNLVDLFSYIATKVKVPTT